MNLTAAGEIVLALDAMAFIAIVLLGIRALAKKGHDK